MPASTGSHQGPHLVLRALSGQNRGMLVGREDERLALDRLMAEARAGHSGVLALVGEPGIGKTAVLDYAAGRAEGMRVLRARGVESEAEVPFAGLAELLRPALPALDRIPAPQGEALAGALALGPATAQDRFAIGAATLSLLSAYAEDAPLALFVDDAHWLDGSSAEAVRFAARRLVADPIALVLAVREGEPSLLDGSDLRTLHMGGLDRTAAETLMERADVPDDVVERLYSATGGNPLALLELAPEASRLAALPGEVPIPISSSIATAFGRRFGALPEPTRRILLVAAAGDAGDPAVLARAAQSLCLDVADLAAAEDAGLVTLDRGQVEFRHPLARSAVYADAPAQERREAHGALADALPDRDVDRRAWHLAAASVGPDERAATALQRAGVRACERSAYAVAAAAFERGARLAPADHQRGELLYSAADAAWLGGDAERTLRLLDDARVYSSDPVLAARVDQLRGHVAMRRGPLVDGCRLVATAAEEIAGVDPELAVVMLAEVVQGWHSTGDTRAMAAAAERAVALAERQDSRRASFFAAMSHAMALVAGGRGDAGAVEARRAVEILEASDELRDDPRLLAWAAFGPIWLREAEAGRSLIDRAFERARSASAVGALPMLLFYLGRDQATSDQWQAADASFDEGIRLARETGQRAELAGILAGLACLDARRGREAQCRAHAAEAAALCDELGIGYFAGWAIQALGDLELGLGRPAQAEQHYGELAEVLRSRENADVDISPAPELVEAYLRLGRPDDARTLASDFAAAAEAKGQPWAMARALRCLGLAGDNGDAPELFEEALRLHARTPDLFEAGRTRLAYGATLRRSRRRIRAREELRAALEIFLQLGSQSWADQATAELAATGETARRRDASTLDDLTPQELQIARLLAGGMTTKEAAAAVFLSPKTVEYHLRHVYAKLGTHSREELAASFGNLSRA
jgi:DNA-binding CsgD family transcriptional regulator